MSLMMFVSETLNIVLIALGAVLVLAVIAILSVKAVKRKRLAAQQQQQQAIDEGVRKKMLEIRNEYLVLPRNITYSVGPEGEIAVGRYILKSSVEGEKTFNLRLNGLVQPFSDGTVITLGLGDTVCAVSNSALIKPYVEDKHVQ